VLGILLAALAVQFVLNGIGELVRLLEAARGLESNSMQSSGMRAPAADLCRVSCTKQAGPAIARVTSSATDYHEKKDIELARRAKQAHAEHRSRKAEGQGGDVDRIEAAFQ
jgi:hypothetical protein